MKGLNPAKDENLKMATGSSNTGRPVRQRFQATEKVTLQRLSGKLQATEGKQLSWVVHGDEAGNGDGAEAVRNLLPQGRR